MDIEKILRKASDCDLLSKNFIDLQAKYDTLKQSHDKLVEYAQHKPDCNMLALIRCTKVNGKPIGCTCGFEQAIAEAEKI